MAIHNKYRLQNILNKKSPLKSELFYKYRLTYNIGHPIISLSRRDGSLNLMGVSPQDLRTNKESGMIKLVILVILLLISMKVY